MTDTPPRATCDASMLIPGPDSRSSAVGPCILRAGHDGPVHQDANGARWWPNTDPGTDARAVLREVLATFAVATTAGRLVGYAGPEAVAPEDFERWHAALGDGTAPWPNLKEMR